MSLLNNEMYVIKRDGRKEQVSFDKILNRVRNVGLEIPDNQYINYTSLTMKVIEQIYDGIKTVELDELTAQQCASMITSHPYYDTLGSRILVSNHHKNTESDMYVVVDKLYHFIDKNGVHHPLVSDEMYRIVSKYKNEINDMIDYERDYLFDYFGYKTLERAYLMRINDKIVERPQHMWMRVSIGIHGDNLDKIRETYDLMSSKYFTHATPALFNSGTPHPQMSSCYLLAMESDSINGIYNTLQECANISKWAGGIGLHIHNIRANGSHIRGTNGKGTGIVPMLRVFNSTARYVNQGGKRNGSFAIYLEPWHADIHDFLQMRKNHGDEELKARDLFYALWIPDLFMKRVKENKKWTLMCPDECPGLSDVYGEDFVRLYERYEREGRGREVCEARKVWFEILSSQIETGTPYMLYKDTCNIKSNQKNLGTIKSSNLCTEIIEYSDKDETAVCNLASIGLSKFVEMNENIKNLKKNDLLFKGEDGYVITIYSKKGCKYCDLTKLLCKNYNLKYQEVVVTTPAEKTNMMMIIYQKVSDLEKYKEYVENGTLNTVKELHSFPQIIVNGRYIGGYKDFDEFTRPVFNYDKLHQVTKVITYNLNKVIDRNFYPTIKTRRSNMRHRPIGIGVQGLADAFTLMNVPFDSEFSREVNNKIFSTIYHASLEESLKISKERNDGMKELKALYGEGFTISENDNGKNTYKVISLQDRHLNLLEKLRPTKEELEKLEGDAMGAYSSFVGSPISEGILQFDMWNKDYSYCKNEHYIPTGKMNWKELKREIRQYGIRNSLLVAPMPTASTSQILGNNECIEPFTSNIYLRRTLAGEFVVVNKYLMKELFHLGIWSNDVKNKIVLNKGSIQNIEEIPSEIKQKYKIVWEIPMKSIIQMAVQRGRYICQSQSLNLWMDTPSYNKLTAMHFYAWEQGLKTGIYYLRTKAKAAAQQFTIDPKMNKNNHQVKEEEEGCVMCSA